MEINYQTIYDYLRFGRYQCGSSDNQKRATRNKAKKFTSLVNALTKVTGEKPDEWDEYIDPILFAYRCVYIIVCMHVCI